MTCVPTGIPAVSRINSTDPSLFELMYSLNLSAIVNQKEERKGVYGYLGQFISGQEPAKTQGKD